MILFTRRQLWTESELAILKRDLDSGLTPEQSAKNLPGRTPEAIATQRSTRFGIARDRFGGMAVHVRLRIGRNTYARAAKAAKALRIMPAAYLRRVIEQAVDGNEARLETPRPGDLSTRARGHFIAEAAKRGVTVPELFGALLEAIAESQLTDAVLDDGQELREAQEKRA